MTTVAQRHGWRAEREAREWLRDRYPGTLILRLSPTECCDYVVIGQSFRAFAEAKYGKAPLADRQSAFLEEQAELGHPVWVLRYDARGIVRAGGP